jgi:hypothetical protein
VNILLHIVHDELIQNFLSFKIIELPLINMWKETFLFWLSYTGSQLNRNQSMTLIGKTSQVICVEDIHDSFQHLVNIIYTHKYTCGLCQVEQVNFCTLLTPYETEVIQKLGSVDVKFRNQLSMMFSKLQNQASLSSSILKKW